MKTAEAEETTYTPPIPGFHAIPPLHDVEQPSIQKPLPYVPPAPSILPPEKFDPWTDQVRSETPALPRLTDP